MMGLPALQRDSFIALETGALVRSLVEEMVDEGVVSAEHRAAATILVCSIFSPIFANEDRICAWTGLRKHNVWRMGQRLRSAGVWVGTHVSYEDAMDWSERSAEISLVSFAMAIGVAQGQFDRTSEGWGLAENALPLTYEHLVCFRCGTTQRYVSTLGCRRCAVDYQKTYERRRQTAARERRVV